MTTIAVRRLAHCRGPAAAGLRDRWRGGDGFVGRRDRAADHRPRRPRPGADRVDGGAATGHEWQIRPRSGLALKNGILVANSPGTVDEDYRGEVLVIVLNAGDAPFVVERGMRIAQAVLAPVTRGVFVEVADLPETQRGAGGFGSTGT